MGAREARESENLMRAGKGMDVVEWAAGRVLGDRDEIRAEAVDLMANVLHALGRWGFDAEAAHAMAWRHYVAEREGS